MRYLPTAIGLALACGSFSASHAPGPATAAPPPAAVGPVITRFVMRRQVIVVRAGANGPTYGMETLGGSTLVPPATVGQLATRSPELLRTVRTMQSAVLWAGAD